MPAGPGVLGYTSEYELAWLQREEEAMELTVSMACPSVTWGLELSHPIVRTQALSPGTPSKAPKMGSIATQNLL